MFVYSCSLAKTCQGCATYLTHPRCPYWYPKPKPPTHANRRADPDDLAAADRADQIADGTYSGE